MPSATTSRRAAPLPPDERRAAVVRAVLPLMLEHGVGVTTRELARAAGVSEGTLFNVFADKDELIGAVVEALLDLEPFERAIEAIDPDVPFYDRLAAATEIIQRRVVDVWKLVSQLDTARHAALRKGPFPDSPALIALLATESGRLREAPADAARLLRAMALALSHPHMVDTPRPPADIVDLFLNGAMR
ncbi:MAG: TetR/AcrR family transcriptional regulator [Ilumatobacteraceae bacterium]|nr:TetR/AcrR family transcriptional regulator [Ilumatobacteraceae bacterium]